MAFVQDEEQQNTPGAGGQVLAGSGGAASQGPKTTGTGFTNLQTYLSANKGSGGGVAGEIASQGQNAVSEARKTADDYATSWGDQGVQRANTAAQDVAGQYNSAAERLNADPYDQTPYSSFGTYGGPQSAGDVQGFNQLEQNYQKVADTAKNFAGDMNTQQAGLKNKFGYSTGFAALDTFLGRQDGRDKLQSWAAGVDPGSAQGQVDRVNSAISGGKQSITDASNAFTQANADAKRSRSTADKLKNASLPQPTTWGGVGIASRVEDPVPTAVPANEKEFKPTRAKTTTWDR